MAAVQPIRQQSYEQVYNLLRTAILRKHCLSATYKGYHRLLCPFILGRNRDGVPQVLAYQYGGVSRSGLGPPGSPDNWRCIAVEKLSDVKLVDGQWLTPPNHFRPQTCIEAVEYDANLPGLLAQGAVE